MIWDIILLGSDPSRMKQKSKGSHQSSVQMKNIYVYCSCKQSGTFSSLKGNNSLERKNNNLCDYIETLGFHTPLSFLWIFTKVPTYQRMFSSVFIYRETSESLATDTDTRKGEVRKNTKWPSAWPSGQSNTVPVPLQYLPLVLELSLRCHPSHTLSGQISPWGHQIHPHLSNNKDSVNQGVASPYIFNGCVYWMIQEVLNPCRLHSLMCSFDKDEARSWPESESIILRLTFGLEGVPSCL